MQTGKKYVTNGWATGKIGYPKLGYRHAWSPIVKLSILRKDREVGSIHTLVDTLYRYKNRR